MLTFTSPGGQTVQFVNGGKKVSVFPGKDTIKADLALLKNPEEEPGNGTISWPGEYDYDGVAVRGIGHGEGDKVSYTVEADGVRMAFLSSPLEELSDHQLEIIGDIDILFLPADSASLAQKLIDQIEPRALIPLPSEDQDIFVEILKNCGAQGKEPQDEYKIKGKGSLPAEGREVVILKAGK